jgi:hypothetical protein
MVGRDTGSSHKHAPPTLAALSWQLRNIRFPSVQFSGVMINSQVDPSKNEHSNSSVSGDRISDLHRLSQSEKITLCPDKKAGPRKPQFQLRKSITIPCTQTAGACGSPAFQCFAVSVKSTFLGGCEQAGPLWGRLHRKDN